MTTGADAVDLHAAPVSQGARAIVLADGNRERELGHPCLCFPCGLQLDVDVLLGGEKQHFLETFLAADARLLDAAERRAKEMLADLVDPHEAGLHSHRRAVRGGDVVGPDRAGQAVLDRVDLGQHVRLAAPFEDAEHGAEDLLARNAHARGDTGEHGRLDVKPLGEPRSSGRLPPSRAARPRPWRTRR
jgi:hypothetical protein